jgi:GNAT superfamily N-acetyltransferase
MNNLDQKFIINAEIPDELKRIAHQFLNVTYNPKELLLVEDYPDHRKYLHVLGIMQLADIDSIYVSFSKAFNLQLQDDLETELIKKRRQGDLDQALAIRIFKADSLPENPGKIYEKISNRQNRIGSFYFEQSAKGWSLLHRVIIPEFRNKNIASQIMKFAEQIYQEMANLIGNTQLVFISAGQKSVIQFARKNGYQPYTELDQISLERMDTEAFDQKIGSLSINGDWKSQPDNDPYLFEKNSIHQSIKDAIRVKLVKIIKSV